MQDKMKYLSLSLKYLFAFLFVVLTDSRSWAASKVDNGFLSKKDFLVAMDTSLTVAGVGTVSPVATEFNFSSSGDTTVKKNVPGHVFTTDWKSKCQEDRTSCDFFLTVVQQGKDSASLPGNGSVLHTRIYEAGSKKAIEISTRIILEEKFSKLEATTVKTIGDSIIEQNTSRKVENFKLPNASQGYELKFSINTSLGKQSLSLYSRVLSGSFKLPQAKINFPLEFSADSISFFITDSSQDAKNFLSEAFAGSRSWNYVPEDRANYLKKLSKGVRPGNLANFDYFGEAIFQLIKSTENPNNPFGTWESYIENSKMLRNAAGGGEILPIQILRTTFHEKAADGTPILTPFFLCTSPKFEIRAEAADLFIDPASIFGDGELREVKVKIGKVHKILAIGEKMKIDFNDGLEKALTMEVIYKDGFKVNVPLTFHGPATIQ